MRPVTPMQNQQKTNKGIGAQNVSHEQQQRPESQNLPVVEFMYLVFMYMPGESYSS